MKTNKGFKVTDENMKCRDFQFELGKEFKHEGEIELCKSGFHFCKKLIKCFDYYDFHSKNRVFEIEHGNAIGDVDDKMVTDSITLLRELSWNEVLEKVNIGVGNSGDRNSGNYNSGDRNSGDWNSGDYNSGDYNSGGHNSGYRNSGHHNSGYRNSGDWNSGNWNSGYRNSGDRNSGHYNSGYRNSGNYNSDDYNSGDHNSGYRNSGDWNSGDWNSGNWNSGHHNSGYLNTNSPKLRIFNKETDVDITNIDFPDWMYFEATKWIRFKDMTKEEKTNHKDAEVTGGYLKTLDYKEAAQLSYNEASKEEQDAVELLPNYDADILFEVFGIDRRNNENA